MHGERNERWLRARADKLGRAGFCAFAALGMLSLLAFGSPAARAVEANTPLSATTNAADGSDEDAANTLGGDLASASSSDASTVPSAQEDSSEKAEGGSAEDPANEDELAVLLAETEASESGTTMTVGELADVYKDALADGLYRISSASLDTAVIGVSSNTISGGAAVAICNNAGIDAQLWRVSHDDQGFITLTNVKSGLVLDVRNGKASSGTVLQLWASNGSSAQKWVAVPDGDSLKLVSGLGVGLVVDAVAGSVTAGTGIQLYASNDTQAQRWVFTSAKTETEQLDELAQEHAADLADGIYTVSSSLRDEAVFDAANGGTSNGTAVQLYAKNDTDAQVWSVSHDEKGYVTLTNVKSGLVLDVPSASTSTGVGLQLWQGNNSVAQKWVAVKDGETFKLVSALGNNLVIDARSGQAGNGTRIQTYSSNDTLAQRWCFVETKTESERLDELAGEHVDDLADGTYVVSSAKLSTAVLDVCNGATSNGTAVQLYSSNGTDAQSWKVTHDAKGYVTLTNTASGRALDVRDGSANSGACAQIYESNDSRAQKWVAVRDGGSVKLVSALGVALVLDASSGSTNNGTRVQIWQSNDSTAQRWVFDKIPQTPPAKGRTIADGVYQISASGLVFDVPSGSSSNGVKLQSWTSNGTLAQAYKVTYDSASGYYTIKNVNSGKCLDLTDGAAAVGASVQQWEPSSGSSNVNQLWSIQPNDNGGYTIASAKSYRPIGLTSASSGAKLVTAREGDSFAFDEFVPSISEGYYTFASSVAASKVLDVASGSWDYGPSNLMQLWDANGTWAQLWYVRNDGSGVVTIQNVNSGGYLTDNGGGAIIQSWNTDDSRRWKVSVSEYGYVFANVKTGLALTAQSGSNGARVQGATNNSLQAQSWSMQTSSFSISSGDFWEIAPADGPGYRLDVAGGSKSDGGNVQIWSSAGNLNQKWWIRSAGDGWYTFTSACGAKVLDIANGSSASGANVQQWSSNGSSAQKWRFEMGEYGLRIVSARGTVLDVSAGTMANGSNVQAWAANGTKAQAWRLYKTSTPSKIGYQNPSGFYQVSSWDVSLEHTNAGIFSYVTPSRISIDATRSDCVEAFIARAWEYVGTPYVWDYACAPGVGVDCVGLVMQCAYATGMDLGEFNPYEHYYTGPNGWHSHDANNLWNYGSAMHVSLSDRQRGDVLSWAGHVAIYLGDDMMIEANGSDVHVTSMWSFGTPRGCIRLFQ